MKKGYLISISLLAIILLSSCKKEPLPSIYKGRILERVSNKPIPNARISVMSCTASFDTGQLSCVEVDSFFSDAEGRCNYTLLADDLWFFAEKENYYKDTEGLRIINDNLKQIQLKKDIFLDAKAWLDLRMVREAPFDEDCISVVGLKPGDSNSGCKNMSDYYIYNGAYSNQGYDSLQIVWRIRYADGRFQQKQKGIYLKGLDTTVFELKF